MPKSKRTAHYVASSHWDREWYECRQHYRFRLVAMLDELLDTMEKEPAFRYFQSDGQTILWEDYLELRPEREAQIRRFTEQGRIRMGPWYVLPDEFIPSGESLIRNLQMGIKVASRFGPASRVGFVCDIFGHISQLPQILRGFGIDNAFLWRGTNESTHGAMFRWQAPDGSEVIAYRFGPPFGYVSYQEKVRRWAEPDRPFDFDQALTDLRGLLDIELERCPTDAVLIFDGGDHVEIEPATTRLLKAGNDSFEDVELIHSHLDGFVEDIREQRDRITKVFKGELRDPGEVGEEAWLIAGVLSSRIPLKQANARCENELCLWAEPFSTFATLHGATYPAPFIESAWRYLIQNHPHDSICTCSLDQVHRDMAYRFEQCESIATHVTRNALRYIADRVELPAMDKQDLAIVLFNPSANEIAGPVDLTLSFPKDTEAVYQEFFGYEPKIGFRLYDSADQELAYQYVSQRNKCSGFRRRYRKLAEGQTRHEVDVCVPVTIPPYGYTRIMCRPVKKPTRHLGSMLVDDHTLENESLRVSVAPNGTLTLTDKRNGLCYCDLLTMEDAADIADGWHRGIAVNDEVFTSVASRGDVALTADGIAKATLRIRLEMRVPERFLFDSMRRSDTHIPFVVTHYVTLRQGQARVEIRTEVENTARDHRLRVFMPTGAEATHYLADGAFDVVERPIALREDNARYKELELETKPQYTWTAVHDERRGLAVISTGLPESGVRDLPTRPIALTLLRSFMKTPFTDGEHGGQIQGQHEFRYWIVPLQGQPEHGELCRLGQHLAAGVRSVQVDSRDRGWQEKTSDITRSLPPVHSFLQVDSAEPVATAISQSTGSQDLLLRMFNPAIKPVAAPVLLEGKQAHFTLVDLEGHVQDAQGKSGQEGMLHLQPKEIKTVRIAASHKTGR